MKKWWVVTPEYTYTEPILDDGSGPSYPVRDCVEIEAETKEDAKILGVKYMRERPREFEFFRYNDACPYTGITVEESQEAPFEPKDEDIPF